MPSSWDESERLFFIFAAKFWAIKFSAIQHRDLIGPRKPVKVEPETQKSKLHHLLELQRKQWSRNQKHQAQTGSFKVFRLKTLKLFKFFIHQKQADSDDVRFVMSLGFQNALSWANHFETFTKLSEDQKALVMSEFGIAFILIEQAFKTAEDTEEGCWILQNDTFLEISDTRNVQGQKRYLRTYKKLIAYIFNNLELTLSLRISYLRLCRSQLGVCN